MQTAETKKINGVDVNQLTATINQVKGDSKLARFKFKISNQWLEGGHNCSTVQDFHGAMQDIAHANTFKMDADEPAILLGEDRGANPVEYLLHALVSCVTTSMVYHAAARGIKIEEVESDVSGNLDLRGFLGLDKKIRKGFQDIRIEFRIKADAPDDKLEELARLGQEFSPVFDSVTSGVPVTVSAKKM